LAAGLRERLAQSPGAIVSPGWAQVQIDLKVNVPCGTTCHIKGADLHEQPQRVPWPPVWQMLRRHWSEDLEFGRRQL